ncbi:AAA family ATPase [Spirulina sp. CCNP1310]|uniref:MinD/ParA family ATP-binding protein n=1 Tax=Spirulina sp. CCNP1310 TaxID=3110249 RepID=UPI002B1F3163|nr:AAA family ATPase [Spirulina sp. CCNP1310]MEA5420662.1 AAA family ATPase [Spirulina sp. CCNP1310]
MNASTLRKELKNTFSNNFQLDVGDGGFVLLTIISEKFNGKSRAERLQEVEPLIQKAGLSAGIIELYNPDEAVEQGIALSDTNNDIPTSWQKAVDMLASGKTFSEKNSHRIKRVVFYSYKGGVGRTTALIQTAFQLIRSGKRVVIVDMDVEAPGLHTLLPAQKVTSKVGLVDYLWERQTCFFNEDHQPQVELGGDKGIIYSVTDSHSKRPLFVVPAGNIGRRYVQRLSLLTTTHLFDKTDDPWLQFERELWEQFQPDIMLIDARTGLNEWGGFTLLGLADDIFIVLYPSEQNAEGVRFIKNTLNELSRADVKLVLSPVPEGIIGTNLVENIKKSLALTNDQQQELIQIPYHPNIAGVTQFPVETALPYYAPIANYLLEKSSVLEADALITTSNRLNLVRSLSFSERDAASILDNDFDKIFQKTTDFERCLDDAVWVIRGRKGTGKSTLYTLFTQHRQNAEKYARGRLENITLLSGHGNSDQFRPTGDVFAQIHQKLDEHQKDWLSLWRAYAVIQIYRSIPEFMEILKQAKFKSLLSRLKYNFSLDQYNIWEAKHTHKLVEFVTDEALNSCCRDVLSYYDQSLGKLARKIWLLYDDLDQDIQENSPWQQAALGGLMRLIYDLNNQGLYHIRFKIFLREDIWSNLIFTNKSHFGEARTLLLQWGKIDFLRLAYRLAISGSIDFKMLSNRVLPLADNEIDEAPEEALRQALAPLWGLKVEKGKNAYVSQWVYSRLTDASNNTYPRSLNILLNTAREVELAASTKNIAHNRLLGWNSLTKGLEAASQERCDAIKNEHPEFEAFFKRMNELSSLFNREELEPLCRDIIANQSHWTFESFLKRLQQIGLIAERRNKKRYGYAVADLYVYGFGVKRKQGQRK